MLHNHNFPSRCTPITQAIFSCCFTNQLESKFEYTFDNIAEVINDFVEEIKLEKYSIYVHDYGAPVGFRLATKHPERIQVIITQNGNAYEEGLLSSLDPMRTYWENPSEENKENIRKILVADFTKYQYVNGTHNPDIISPDSWNLDQYVLDRLGNKEIQLALFYDYQNNLKQYPTWHEYFRKYQPPTLVAWGKTIFSLDRMVHWHSRKILKMWKFIIKYWTLPIRRRFGCQCQPDKTLFK